MALKFCGQSVLLPRGPATLSIRSGAPVVPLFLIREGIWRFRLHVEPPIWPSTTHASAEAIAELAQAYTTVIERYIKQFAAQWLLFQRLKPGSVSWQPVTV